jgi:uncharacterized membrane protein
MAGAWTQKARNDMANCSKCGNAVADGMAYCPHCGTPAGGGAVVVSAAPAVSGLRENVAGLLCYVVGWITGIIFLIVDKRPTVRFHAAQSIVVFGALNVLRVVITFGFMGTWRYGYGALGFWSLWGLVSWVLTLVTLILWVVLMVTAYQGKRVEIPIAAGIANSIVGKM